MWKRKRLHEKFLWSVVEDGDGGGADTGTPAGSALVADANPPATLTDTSLAASAITTSSATPAAVAAASGGQSTYPPNTPVAEMTPQQQTAYYKHQLYLERAASKKAKDDMQLAATQAAMSEQERAVAAARVEERETVTKELRDVLVQAKFDAIGIGLNADQLASLKANINSSAFVGDDGRPDDTKIANFLALFQGSATLSNRDLRPSGSNFHGSSIAAEMKKMEAS